LTISSIYKKLKILLTVIKPLKKLKTSEASKIISSRDFMILLVHHHIIKQLYKRHRYHRVP
jgi:hypothetical protein